MPGCRLCIEQDNNWHQYKQEEVKKWAHFWLCIKHYVELALKP